MTKWQETSLLFWSQNPEICSHSSALHGCPMDCGKAMCCSWKATLEIPVSCNCWHLLWWKFSHFGACIMIVVKRIWLVL